MNKKYIPFIVVLLVLVADQWLKIWVKTNMDYGQSIQVLGSWFQFHFIENEGMAFGKSLPIPNAKLILTLFRIGAVIFIGYYVIKLIQKKASKGLIICISLILAGALGNIIDSVFYGVIFDEVESKAKIFSDNPGYSSYFHGNVVDMLYVELYDGYWPSWMPFVGGDRFVFFRPVFNIADSAITCGVFAILIFQRRFFKKKIVGDPEPTNSDDYELSLIHI